MKRLISLLFFLGIFLSPVGCGISLPYVGDELGPRSSIFQVQMLVTLQRCSKGPGDMQICTQKTVTGVGTAFVVQNLKKGAFLISAGHVCSEEYVRASATKAGLELVSHKLKIVDIDGKKYNVRVINYNFDFEELPNGFLNGNPANDICVLYGDKVIKRAIPISKYMVGKLHKVMTLGGTGGIWEPGVVLVSDLRYAGTRVKGDLLAEIYNGPSGEGASGSPILNSRRQVIGLVSSGDSRYDHTVLSPTRKQIIHFYKESIKTFYEQLEAQQQERSNDSK